MTPEQRELLDGMADYAELFARMWAERNDKSSEAWHKSRVDALRAALVERTCGTCRHCEPLRHDHGLCRNDEASAFGSGVDLDDGCIKGWEAKS